MPSHKVTARRIAPALLAVALLCSVLPGSAAAEPNGESGQQVGSNRLISRTVHGRPAGGDYPSASDGGRWVAFSSRSPKIIAHSPCPAAYNNGPCNYVYDRKTGVTTLISRPVVGDRLSHGVGAPSISADGGVVVYSAFANNLVTDDANQNEDVFLYDRTNGVTELLSRSPNGRPANGDSVDPDVSADGRYVVFHSSARNLVPGDTNGATFDVFRLDRVTGTMSVLNLTSNGDRPEEDSEGASVSDDGAYVSFESASPALVTDDHNGSKDIFVHEVATGLTQLVSRTSDHEPANGDSYEAWLSGDGWTVTFGSEATDLVEGDTNSGQDVFVADRTTAAVELVSRTPEGVPGGRFSLGARPSRDGSTVAFVSAADDLVEPETYGYVDIFTFDRASETVTWISHTKDGSPPTGQSWRPNISGEGSFVVYASIAANLVRDGSRRNYNVILYRLR